MGTIYKRGKTYWIKYYRDGSPRYESARTADKQEARRLLQTREGDAARGVPILPKAGRVSFGEAARDIMNEYVANGRRSVENLEQLTRKHLEPVFGNRYMAGITTSDVHNYIAARQKEGAANASINRELSILKRMFALAVQSGKLLAKPYIPTLKERNVRQGFFEPDQFEAVVRELIPELRAPITFAYITGWRVPSEVLPLTWRLVDFPGGVVRLDAGTTKNDEARTFPMTRELRELLTKQREHVIELEHKHGRVIPFVFPRETGEPIRDFHWGWWGATRRAGVPSRVPHDFRRSAVRNLVRAGIPEAVAMKMTGHRTRRVFERYNIVSPGDLKEAAAKLDAVTSRPAARSLTQHLSEQHPQPI